MAPFDEHSRTGAPQGEGNRAEPARAEAEQTGTPAAKASASAARPSWPVLANGAPDFGRMTSTQRRAYDQHRLTRKFG
jgi:hypothetical protein